MIFKDMKGAHNQEKSKKERERENKTKAPL
jgi:hypothetical protein